MDYYIAHNSIQYHIKDVVFKSCLEIGPGPGTWTRLLYRENMNAFFDLVDISEEMFNQFKLEMREKENVHYNVADIFEFNLNKKYDLVFSSRAIEYFENKDDFLKKVFDSLSDNGTGIIITKNPEYGFRKNDKRWQHSGQIGVDQFSEKLKNLGFKNIKIYPVIMRTPILDRFSLSTSEKIYKNVYNKEISKKILRLTESYLVKFSK